MPSEHAADLADGVARRAAPERGRDRWHGLLPLVPGLVFLLLFMLFPLSLSIYYSLQPNALLPPQAASAPAANYVYLLKRHVYVDAFLRTLRLAAYVVTGALLLGYPTALALRRYHARLGSTLILGLSFPILAGPLVIVLGWMLLFIRGGPVNQLLMTLGLIGQPIVWIGTERAVAIALIQFTLAFVVLSIFNSLMRIDPALIEAAGSLGANPVRAFWYVTWPLSLPGVVSGSILAFSLAVGAFMAPHYLGGDTRLVATTLIAQFMLTAFNWELAATAAILLVGAALVFIAVYNKAVGRLVERRFGLHG